MSAEATSPLATVEDSLLASYSALPGVLKSRMAPLLPTNLTLGSSREAEDKMNQLAPAERLSGHAAALALMQRYTIVTAHRQSWHESASDLIFSRIIERSSNITYEEVAPIFGLATQPAFPALPLYRSRLPLQVVKDICKQIDYSRVFHGDQRFANSHVDCPSRYFTALFIILVDIFGANMTDHLPIFGEREWKPAMIEHSFTTFHIRTFLVMVQRRPAPRNNLVAQLLAQCEAWDFKNNEAGHWVPITGVLCDDKTFQFFIYDSSDRRFYASEILPNFPGNNDGREFLQAIRIAAERFYDLFILSYINALRSKIPRSQRRMSPEDLKARFRSALPEAEAALGKARLAAKLAEAVKDTDPITALDDADRLAEQGFKELKQSVKNAPQTGNMWRYMDRWEDDMMRRC